jgi:hypothetical protein
MGNWQLEVGKMVVYIFMPVAAFYGYHQARRSQQVTFRGRKHF